MLVWISSKMVIASFQMIGYISCVLTLAGCFTSALVRDWKHGTSEDGALIDLVFYHGLWSNCFLNKNGYMHCKAISTPFYKLTGVLPRCRVLTVMACIISLMGLVITPFGMVCTSLVENPRTKVWLVRFGGSLFLLAGVLMCVAVSGYAYDIKSSYDPEKVEFIYGSCLLFGWAASAFGFMSGMFLFYGSCQNGKFTKVNSSTPLRANPTSGYVACVENPQQQLMRFPRAPSSSVTKCYSVEERGSVIGNEIILSRPRSVSSQSSPQTPRVNATIFATTHYVKHWSGDDDAILSSSCPSQERLTKQTQKSALVAQNTEVKRYAANVTATQAGIELGLQHNHVKTGTKINEHGERETYL